MYTVVLVITHLGASAGVEHIHVLQGPLAGGAAIHDEEQLLQRANVQRIDGEDVGGAGLEQAGTVPGGQQLGLLGGAVGAREGHEDLAVEPLAGVAGVGRDLEGE